MESERESLSEKLFLQAIEPERKHTMKNLINNLITDKKLVNYKPISIDGKDGARILLKVDKKVYLHNKVTNKAYIYIVDDNGVVVDFTPTTLAKYNAACAICKAQMEQAALDRKAAELRAKEAERKACYNEARNINAPATQTAIRLDAEREDSKFDGRQATEIFSQSEAEAYENRGDFFDDEDPVVTLGYHKAIFLGYDVEAAKAYTGRDGERYETKAYLKMRFSVDGVEFVSRLYRAGMDSFKRNINKAYKGLFTYTPEKKAMELLVGEQIEIWVKYNDMLNELQAEYYDVEAYRAYKAEKAKAAHIRRTGTNRVTENKATR